jgi:hypothetical protein
MRTDITLTAWLKRVENIMKKNRGAATYKGANDAAVLAMDIGYAFNDFPKSQWDRGLKASWNVALAMYGKEVPINQTNWEHYIKKSWIGKKP